MSWESALGSAIEVAIGLAGFSGIIAAVGRRGAGSWTAADEILLRILLFADRALPITGFGHFQLPDGGLLCGCSGCWIVARRGIRGVAVMQARKYLQEVLMALRRRAVGSLLPLGDLVEFGSDGPHILPRDFLRRLEFSAELLPSPMILVPNVSSQGTHLLLELLLHGLDLGVGTNFLCLLLNLLRAQSSGGPRPVMKITGQ